MDFLNWSSKFRYENIRFVMSNHEKHPLGQENQSCETNNHIVRGNATIAFYNVYDTANYVVINNCCKLEVYSNPRCILVYINDNKTKKITIQCYLLLNTYNDDDDNDDDDDDDVYKIDMVASNSTTVDEFDIIKCSAQQLTGNVNNERFIFFVVS